ncbi:metal-sensitive transcriptional regulator [Clostridium sp. MSJ-11]|uniref:Metal-sensitive transcriptional regulator n=1 Tax=Clostridium mobile TaxID=2841512 RepID=A0ABS6EI66_9CLOT|nr:metal-sensitive transcriptional regulator [Clostridium mobile]MBU5484905.1 metal-sensitive transcriptional regulator [Clostridium mobile]
MEKNKVKKDIQNRLKRIEGQVKGIEKMVDNDVECKDILIQIAAIRSAINKVGTLIFENYATKCFAESEDNNSENKVEDLVSTLTMFIK